MNAVQQNDARAGVPRRQGITREAITGLVLAGGLGRRMSADGEGVDKGLVELHGRPMVQHAIERLAPQVSAVLVNANRSAQTYARFGWPVLADAVGGFAGPLAGLSAGLDAARTPWLVTVPCDSPFLPTDLVSRLASALVEHGAPIALARAGGHAQPVFALVSCMLGDDLRGFLQAGGRKIDLWTARHGAVEVDFEDAAAFSNINTPQELSRHERP